MKVIFDCTALSNWTGHATGIQRVVSEIGKELKKCLPGTQLGLFTENGCLRYSIEDRSTHDILTLEKNDVVITAGSNWDFPDHHQRLLALKEKGILLGTLFHDTIPVLLPFSYGPGFSAIYEKWLQEALSTSDIGFSNSENTKRDVIQYAASEGISSPPIHFIRLGDDIPISAQIPSEEISTKTKVPFILSVGTFEYRKNHLVLLNAYRYMLERMNYVPPKLFLVGKKAWLDQDIEYQVANDPRLRGHVEILQGISDADLQHLYQQSMFTVYPSFYEGWGLPVAESMCFGKPCIASRSSSMLEIAPNLVRHADPYLVHEWVDQIRQLVDNPDILTAEAKRIKTDYVRQTWAHSAEKMKDALLLHFPQLIETV
jgi:glycosyltransferase involved in cell wall biosynthesis